MLSRTDMKAITVWANQKSWLTGEVYWLLNAQNAVFKAGDKLGLKTARAKLLQGIRVAKRQHYKRIAPRVETVSDSMSRSIGKIITYKALNPDRQMRDCAEEP